MPTASDTESTSPPAHLVQLYEADERALVENVARYLDEGLRVGAGVLVVANRAHRAQFIRELARIGDDPDRAMRTEQLAFLDANETLARFMRNGHPDADRFDGSVGEAVRRASARSEGNGLRIYGDMVGVLWRERQFPAAIRLEQLWNKLQKTISFQLYCAYPIDIFDRTFDINVIDALLCAHTHLLPSRANPDLEAAIRRATAEVLGQEADAEHGLAELASRPARAAIPGAEAEILWLRTNRPDHADEILARARLHYQASA